MNEPAQTKLFYARPLVLAAIGFCAGILIGKHVLGAPAYGIALFAFVGGIVLLTLKQKKAAVLLIACALGLVRIQLAYPVLPAPAISGALNGVVATTPLENGTNTRLVLKNASYAGRKLDGRVLLVLETADLQVAYGDTVETTATLSLPQGKRNEGDMDMRFYLFTQRIAVQARAENASVTPAEKQDIYGVLLTLRARTTNTLLRLMGKENGAVAAAMLHGDTWHIQEETLRDFRASGIAHLLAVSGLHVSLLAGALLILLRRLQPGTQFCIVLVCLLFYSAFTAFSPSTVRASIMTLCLLLGRVVWRKPDTLCSLALALLSILLYNPFSLFAVGLQLSFSAVLGIVLLAPVLQDALRKLPAPVAGALGVSLAAQIGIFPATAAYFNHLPLMSTPANLLVVPLAPLVVLPSLIALFLYPLFPVAALAVAGVADITLHLMRAVAALTASFGGASVSSPSLFAAALFFAAVVFLSPYCFAQKQPKRILCAVSCTLCLCVWMLPKVLLPRTYMTVLDIPYGYAAHLHTPKNDTLLGTAPATRGYTANAYLEYHGIAHVQYVDCSVDETEILFGEQTVRLCAEGTSVNGVFYPVKENGQMRIYSENNTLRVLAYARDRNYGILIPK